MPSMASLILRAVARAANSAAWAASRCGTAAAAAAAARSGSGGVDPLMRASSVAAPATRRPASSGSSRPPIAAQRTGISRSQVYGSKSTVATLPPPFNGPPFVKPDWAIFEADEKDLESDEALWALYERWCKVFNQKRDRDEMARRFHRFKKTVLMVEENKRSDLPYRLGINQFADGKARQLQGCSTVKRFPDSAPPNFS